ncbi:DUF1203 domain-containing protein [Halpernia sp. GG3]
MENFRIKALNNLDFLYLNKLSDDELTEKNMVIMKVNKFPGFPCRVTLEDAEIGEEVYLLNYNFLNVDSPYKTNGPIFIRKNKKTVHYSINEIPKMLNHRLLSLRVYDKKNMMIYTENEILEGKFLQKKLHQILENRSVDYIQIHNAKPGCFNCTVERV